VIDLKLLRDDPDRVRASQRARGEDPDLVDVALAADERRRAAVTRYDSLRAEQKTIGKQVAAAGKGPDDARHALLARAKDLAGEVKDAEAEQGAADNALRDAQLALSNVIEDGVPVGGEDDFVVIATAGQPREFDFTPRDHVELGELLGAIDIARGAKVGGSRFYFLTGQGARLELGLLNLAMSRAIEAGFSPMVVPLATSSPSGSRARPCLNARSCR
jgi:seryl-tRNA synthetase